METFVDLNHKEVLLEVTLYSPKNSKHQLLVYDPYFRNTHFTDREMYFNGTKTFFVRMPLSPKSAKVFSTANIIKVEQKPLPKKFSIGDVLNINLKSFVNLAQEFCLKAGYLYDNFEYVSNDGKYVIKYLPTLFDDDGKESATPCRIHKETGVIEVSAKRFREMTIPMRFALLLHEYMHFYKNVDPNSEFEADKNSLFVYLAMGFPRIDALECWLSVFDKSGNVVHPMHKQRLNQIKQIINEFDQKFKEISFIK